MPDLVGLGSLGVTNICFWTFSDASTCAKAYDQRHSIQTWGHTLVPLGTHRVCVREGGGSQDHAPNVSPA